MGTRHLVIVYYKGKYVIAQYGQWDGHPGRQGRDVLEFARDPELMAKFAAALDAGMVYEPTAEEYDDIFKRVSELEKTFKEKERAAQEKRRREAEEDRGAERKPQADHDPRSEEDTVKKNPKFLREDEIMSWFMSCVAGFEMHEDIDRQLAAILEYAMSDERDSQPTLRDFNRLSPGQQACNIICPSLSRNWGAQILMLVAEATEKVPVQNRLDFIADGLWCEWAWVLDLDARVLECWSSAWKPGIWPDSEEPKLQSTRFDHLPDIQSGRGDRPKCRASFALDNLSDESTFLRECGEPESDLED